MIRGRKCPKMHFLSFHSWLLKVKMDIFKMSNFIFFDFRLKKIKKSLFRIFYFYYAKWSQSEKYHFYGGISPPLISLSYFLKYIICFFCLLIFIISINFY